MNIQHKNHEVENYKTEVSEVLKKELGISLTICIVIVTGIMAIVIGIIQLMNKLGSLRSTKTNWDRIMKKRIRCQHLKFKGDHNQARNLKTIFPNLDLSEKAMLAAGVFLFCVEGCKALNYTETSDAGMLSLPVHLIVIVIGLLNKMNFKSIIIYTLYLSLTNSEFIIPQSKLSLKAVDGNTSYKMISLELKNLIPLDNHKLTIFPFNTKQRISNVRVISMIKVKEKRKQCCDFTDEVCSKKSSKKTYYTHNCRTLQDVAVSDKAAIRFKYGKHEIIMLLHVFHSMSVDLLKTQLLKQTDCDENDNFEDCFDFKKSFPVYSVGSGKSRIKRGLSCWGFLLYTYCPQGVSFDDLESAQKNMIRTMDVKIKIMNNAVINGISSLELQINDKLRSVNKMINNSYGAINDLMTRIMSLESIASEMFYHLESLKMIVYFEERLVAIRQFNRDVIKRLNDFQVFHKSTQFCLIDGRCDLFWAFVGKYVPELYNLHDYDKTWKFSGIITPDSIRIIYPTLVNFTFTKVTIPFKPDIDIADDCERGICKCCVRQQAMRISGLVLSGDQHTDEYKKLVVKPFNISKCIDTPTKVSYMYYLFKNTCVRISCRNSKFVDINECFKNIMLVKPQPYDQVSDFMIDTESVETESWFKLPQYQLKNLTIVELQPVDTDGIQMGLRLAYDNLASIPTIQNEVDQSKNHEVILTYFNFAVMIAFLIKELIQWLIRRHIRTMNHEIRRTNRSEFADQLCIIPKTVHMDTAPIISHTKFSVRTQTDNSIMDLKVCCNELKATYEQSPDKIKVKQGDTIDNSNVNSFESTVRKRMIKKDKEKGCVKAKLFVNDSKLRLGPNVRVSIMDSGICNCLEYDQISVLVQDKSASSSFSIKIPPEHEQLIIDEVTKVDTVQPRFAKKPDLTSVMADTPIMSKLYPVAKVEELDEKKYSTFTNEL